MAFIGVGGVKGDSSDGGALSVAVTGWAVDAIGIFEAFDAEHGVREYAVKEVVVEDVERLLKAFRGFNGGGRFKCEHCYEQRWSGY